MHSFVVLSTDASVNFVFTIKSASGGVVHSLLTYIINQYLQLKCISSCN